MGAFRSSRVIRNLGYPVIPGTVLFAGLNLLYDGSLKDAPFYEKALHAGFFVGGSLLAEAGKLYGFYKLATEAANYLI